jgi:hypothetical protein
MGSENIYLRLCLKNKYISGCFSAKVKWAYCLPCMFPFAFSFDDGVRNTTPISASACHRWWCRLTLVKREINLPDQYQCSLLNKDLLLPFRVRINSRPNADCLCTHFWCVHKPAVHLPEMNLFLGQDQQARPGPWFIGWHATIFLALSSKKPASGRQAKRSSQLVFDDRTLSKSFLSMFSSITSLRLSVLAESRSNEHSEPLGTLFLNRAGQGWA